MMCKGLLQLALSASVLRSGRGLGHVWSHTSRA